MEGKLMSKQSKINPNHQLAPLIIYVLTTNQDIDYFITGPGMETDRQTSKCKNLKNTPRIWQCI